MFRPLKDDVSMYASIWRKMSFVISNLSHFGRAPCILIAPVRIRVMLASEKTVRNNSLSIYLLHKMDIYCLIEFTLLIYISLVIQLINIL